MRKTGCNSLLVNALNRIFKTNLSLNNSNWLLYYTPFQETALKWIPRSKLGTPKPRPRWAAHTRIGTVWEQHPRNGTFLYRHLASHAIFPSQMEKRLRDDDGCSTLI